jgi:rod shape-determining protein MreB
MNLFSKHLAIDLGTANTLVYMKGKGVLVNEPTVVALNTRTNAVLAVGDEAKEMIGRTPGNIAAIRPMRDGVIADFHITEAMLRYFMDKAMSASGARKPKVIICIPSGATQVERRALERATYQAGAKEAYLIEEPIAAAIGAGLPVNLPTGSMVVDIGGGTSEMAVFSLGDIVVSRSIRIAGDTFDAAIMHHLKSNYNLIVGERTAEELKIAIGSVFQGDEKESMEVGGRDWITGLPATVRLSAREMNRCLAEPVAEIIENIRLTLDATPPELSSDVMARGIMLTGGGALLKGLDKLIEKETGVRALIAEDPLNCVAVGAGKVLDDLDIFWKILISSRNKPTDRS